MIDTYMNIVHVVSTAFIPGLADRGLYTSVGTQPGPHACAHQHSQKTHIQLEDGGWRGDRADALRSGDP